jgi:hypothetical protein
MRRFCLAGLAIATCVAGGVTLEMPPAQSATSAPLALSGHAPGGLESLRITAFPQTAAPAGEAVDVLVVQPTSTTIDGKDWSASIDPSSIPAADVHENGVVDFTVYLMGSNGTWQANASARAVESPSSGEEAWVDPVESSSYVEHSTSGRGQRAVRSPLALTTDELDEVEDDGVIVARGTQVDPVVALSGCKVVATDDYTTRSTTIGTSYPVGNSEAYMDVDASQGAEYGVALSVTGEYGSFHASGSEFVQTGWGFTWNPNDRARSYRIGVQYRKWETYCWGRLQKVEWLPRAETGGQTGRIVRPLALGSGAAGGRRDRPTAMAPP